MFILRRTKGETDGECWPISAASLFIGRSAQCDVTVGDPTVSRRHCEVYAQNGGIFLRDLGSSNLTLVDGQPVKTAELHPGNHIIVGTAHFVVEESNEEAPAVTAPVPESARRSLAVDRGRKQVTGGDRPRSSRGRGFKQALSPRAAPERDPDDPGARHDPP